MCFRKYDSNGEIVPTRRVGLDCQAAIADGEKYIVENHHKDEVDINEIVRKHGVDLVQKHVKLLQSDAYRFDDVTGNDFQEAMEKVTKAKQEFDQLPSKVRSEFDNSPAKFLDFVHNPANADRMVEMGLANRVPDVSPVQVMVMNPEAPSADADAGT